MTNKNNKIPGAGAVEFTKEITKGLERHQIIEVVSQLMNGMFPDDLDVDMRRIKVCEACNFYYRDKTRPNNSKVCSAECKTLKDTSNRRKKTIKEREHDPSKRPRLTLTEIHYADHLEYPFWVDLDENRVPHNYERPHGNINEIHAARERYEQMGGRQRHVNERNIDYYEGDNW